MFTEVLTYTSTMNRYVLTPFLVGFMFLSYAETDGDLQKVIDKLKTIKTLKCEMYSTISFPFGGAVKSWQSTLFYKKNPADTLIGLNYLFITNPDHRSEFGDYLSYFNYSVYSSFKNEPSVTSLIDKPEAFIAKNTNFMGNNATVPPIHKSHGLFARLPLPMLEFLDSAIQTNSNIRIERLADTTISDTQCKFWKFSFKHPEGTYYIRKMAFSGKTDLPIYQRDDVNVIALNTTLFKHNEFLFIEINQPLPENCFSKEFLLSHIDEGKNKSKGAPHDLVGNKAPNFELPVIGSSEKINLKNFLGKYVLLDFTATWCAPCLPAAKMMKRFEDKFHNNSSVEFFSIYSSSADSEDNLIRYREKQQLSNTMLYDGVDIGEKYNVHGYPTFFLISPKGKVIQQFDSYGESVEQNISTLLDTLLDKS